MLLLLKKKVSDRFVAFLRGEFHREVNLSISGSGNSGVKSFHAAPMAIDSQ